MPYMRKGNIDQELENQKGYKQFEYINEEQPHIYALADLIVSRAGSTVLFELLALKKPNLLIPLSKSASRGDQILNAASFKKQGFSAVLQEEDLDQEALVQAIYDLKASADNYIEAMKKNENENGVEAVMKAIEKIAVDKP